ncbi:MAG: hypothetical protein M3Q55_16640 [Acidobacteriota bacterium]|nr:hypothetical protein [Acidobacteriota bacterium]
MRIQYLLTDGRRPPPSRGLRHTTVMSEFNEMPGMRLTLPQAARLWALSLDDCERVMSDLVRAGFLTLDGHARYGRLADRLSH